MNSACEGEGTGALMALDLGGVMVKGSARAWFVSGELCLWMARLAAARREMWVLMDEAVRIQFLVSPYAALARHACRHLCTLTTGLQSKWVQ